MTCNFVNDPHRPCSCPGDSPCSASSLTGKQGFVFRVSKQETGGTSSEWAMKVLNDNRSGL